MRRRIVIGVMGGSAASAPPGSAVYVLAEATGRAVAAAGAVLLCGGRSGVMEAAAKGARRAGGATVGILPGRTGAANAYLDQVLFTGLGDGRNFVNVEASDALIALAGGAGTLSEIALALKAQARRPKPVVALGAWRFLTDHGYPLAVTDDPEVAVAKALSGLAAAPDTWTDAPSGFPEIGSQTLNRRRFEAFLARPAPASAVAPTDEPISGA